MPPGVLCESVAKTEVFVSIVRIRKHLAAAFIRAVFFGPSLMRLIALAATLAAAAVLLGSEPGWSQNRAPAPQPMRLSAQDVARFKEIIHGVIQNPTYLTPAVHGEFWRILAKTGATPKQVSNMRERMTGMLTVYFPMFWQDALTSLRNRRPYKSAQRQQYENKLLAQRIISKKMIKANDSLIANIASGKPIVHQGRNVLPNEQAIQASLSSAQEIAKRVDWLFTPVRR